MKKSIFIGVMLTEISRLRAETITSVKLYILIFKFSKENRNVKKISEMPRNINITKTDIYLASYTPLTRP
jgi:hypothetical protein